MTRAPSRSTRRSATRGVLRMAVAATVLVAATLALPNGTPAGAVDDPAMCDTAQKRGYFTNAVQAQDKVAGTDNPVVLMNELHDLGVLYLCGLTQLHDPTTASLVGRAPGDVLRAMPLYPSPGGPSTLAMRLLYVTTLHDGSLAATSGLVMMPRAVAPIPAEGRRIVAYTHGTIGLVAGCHNALDASWFNAAARQNILTPILSGGAVLVAPDYPGIGAATPGRTVHSYLLKDEEGNATLDMARAAANLAAVTHVGLGEDNRVAVAGFSQGGHAALATTHRHSAGYAPDVNLVGVGAIAPPASVWGFANDLADQVTTSPTDQYFLAAMAFAMEAVHGTGVVDTTELFSLAAGPSWDNAHHVMKSIVTDNKWALNGIDDFGRAGPVLRPTLSGPLYYGLFNNVDGRTYSQANLGFSTPAVNYEFTGCGNQGAIDHFTKYAQRLGGGTIMAANFRNTDSWQNLASLTEDGAPAGLLQDNTMLLDGETTAAQWVAFGACDPLTQLFRETVTHQPLPACRNPYSAPVLSPPGPAGELAAGYEGSYGFGFLLMSCWGGCEGPTAGKLYGALDADLDGIDDNADPAIPMAPGNVVNHSNLTSTATTALDDTFDFIEAAFQRAETGAPLPDQWISPLFS